MLEPNLIRRPRKFYSPWQHLYCGKEQYFVHFSAVFKGFPAIIQGKALAQPRYFSQWSGFGGWGEVWD